MEYYGIYYVDATDIDGWIAGPLVEALKKPLAAIGIDVEIGENIAGLMIFDNVGYNKIDTLREQVSLIIAKSGHTVTTTQCRGIIMEFTEAEKVRWRWHRLVSNLTSGINSYVEFKEQYVIMGVESLVHGLSHVETKREYGVSLRTAAYYRNLCMKNWELVYPLYKDLVRIGDDRVIGGHEP